MPRDARQVGAVLEGCPQLWADPCVARMARRTAWLISIGVLPARVSYIVENCPACLASSVRGWAPQLSSKPCTPYQVLHKIV